MGLYRDVTAEAYDVCMETAEIRQIHEDGKVTLSVRPVLTGADENTFASVTLTAPDGEAAQYELNKDGETKITVEDPTLWWPNGLGDQPLYSLTFEIFQNGEKEDTVTKTIG